jgi:hypothetical protein
MDEVHDLVVFLALLQGVGNQVCLFNGNIHWSKQNTSYFEM